MTEYPKREKFWAMKLIRLITKTCAAQEISPAGALLLAVIATTEDAAGYRRAVTYFDAQLMPLIGLSSQKTLALARKKCVEAGWLHYEPGNKRYPGKYWTIAPIHASGIDDSPTDEGKFYGETDLNRGRIGDDATSKRENRRDDATSKTADNVSAKGNLFLPIPIPEERDPIPIPGNSHSNGEKPKTTDLVPRELFSTEDQAQRERNRLTGFVEINQLVDAFFEAYPLKTKKGLLLESYERAVAKFYFSGKSEIEAHQFLMSKVREFAKSPAGKDATPDFRISPSKWLDQECWSDDPKTWQKPNGRRDEGPQQKSAPKVLPINKLKGLP